MSKNLLINECILCYNKYNNLNFYLCIKCNDTIICKYCKIKILSTNNINTHKCPICKTMHINNFIDYNLENIFLSKYFDKYGKNDMEIIKKNYKIYIHKDKNKCEKCDLILILNETYFYKLTHIYCIKCINNILKINVNNMNMNNTNMNNNNIIKMDIMLKECLEYENKNKNYGLIKIINLLILVKNIR